MIKKQQKQNINKNNEIKKTIKNPKNHEIPTPQIKMLSGKRRQGLPLIFLLTLTTLQASLQGLTKREVGWLFVFDSFYGFFVSCGEHIF